MNRWDFKVRGSCVALPTPLRDGRLDLLALEKLCSRLSDDDAVVV